METRPGIMRRTLSLPAVCYVCGRTTLATHYDRTMPGFLCRSCAPMAIYIDMLLVTSGLHHPNPHDIPNN